MVVPSCFSLTFSLISICVSFLFVLTIYISNTYFNIFIAANVVGIFRVRSILFCPQVCTAVGIYLCFCWSFCGQIKLRKNIFFPLPDAPEKT